VPITDGEDNSLRHRRLVIEIATGHKAAGIRGYATTEATNTLESKNMHFSDDGIVDNTMTAHNITDGTSAGITAVKPNGIITMDDDIYVIGDEFTIDTGIDPTVTLEWTDDGGSTWKGQLSKTLGAAGDTPTKIVFNNLGASRDRTYRVRGTALANYVITDMYVHVTNHKRNE